MKKTTVLLVEDHAVVRQGLRMLICAEPDIEIVGEAENGQKAVQMAKKIRPNIVVMDLAMPSMNGLEATRNILHQSPESKVLVLSSYTDDDCVRQMMEAGVAGYLTKHSASEDLLSAIREVSKGNGYFSPSIARRLQEQLREAFLNGQPVPKVTRLSPRELEVLRFIAEGYANKQIAAELNLSVKTVEKHRQQVMNKLNIHEVAGLTRYALSKGMVGDTPIPSPLHASA